MVVRVRDLTRNCVQEGKIESLEGRWCHLTVNSQLPIDSAIELDSGEQVWLAEVIGYELGTAGCLTILNLHEVLGKLEWTSTGSLTMSSAKARSIVADGQGNSEARGESNAVGKPSSS